MEADDAGAAGEWERRCACRLRTIRHAWRVDIAKRIQHTWAVEASQRVFGWSDLMKLPVSKLFGEGINPPEAVSADSACGVANFHSGEDNYITSCMSILGVEKYKAPRPA